jgi:hypothetical protein
MLADGARLPDNLYYDMSSGPLLVQLNLLNDQPKNLLTLLWPRCWRAPERRKIPCDGFKSFMVLCLQDYRVPLTPVAVFLLDGVGGPKPILPGPLKGARHEAIFWFDSVILATGALGFVTGAFPPQGPLLLQLTHVVGHLVDGGDGDLDLIWRERLKEGLGHDVVHREGADLLA